jgi:CRP/FNR family transcriptional regulator, cyclic AMP receptor protein
LGKAAKVPELSILFNRRARHGAGAQQRQESAPLVAGIKPGMLRRVKILAEMNEQQLGRFVQFMDVEQVQQFKDIVRQGEAGNSMYLVLEGEVRARLMIGGKETTLATIHAGDFFGEMSLFDSAPRSADVVANQDCVLLKVTTEKYDKMVKEVPELAGPFLAGVCRTLAGRIRSDNKRLKDTLNFGRAAGAGA